MRLLSRWRRFLAGTVALLAACPALPGCTGVADAQSPAPAYEAVRISRPAPAPGATTYVLLSGLMGGVAGYERLAARLAAGGHRIVTIDPYHLSIDSTDVRFVDLARRVDALLARHGVDSAQVVGHAHGAGVALRLAALAPRRVAALYMLDVGALAGTRTRVFSSAMRLAPLIARLPGGRGFIERRIVRGLRENAGRQEWLDEPTRRAYARPVIDNIGRVVAMAGRLARAVEPEPVSAVVGRVRVPVLLILGAAPHESGPDPEEIAALAPLGSGLGMVRLAGVGHFPHEEAPAEVARHILSRRQ